MAVEFDTETVLEALRRPLALVEEPARRAALERYIEAARPHLERAIVDLMAALIEATEEQLGESYRLRLSYRGGVLSLEVDTVPAGGLTDVAWLTADGEMDKVTIRLPAELKDLASQAAASAGISVNSWFIRAVATAVLPLTRDAPRPGERARRRGRGASLHGWLGDH